MAWRLIGTIVITIFFMEFLIMIALNAYSAFIPVLLEPLIDSTMLIVTVVPILYLIFFNPLMEMISKVKDQFEHVNYSNQILQQAIEARKDIAFRTELISEMDTQLQMCDSNGELAMVFSETVEKLMPGDTAKLFLVNPARNELRELPGHKDAAGNPTAVFSLRDCWALRQAQTHIFTEENIEQPCPHLGQDLPAFSLCIPIMTYGELIGLFHISSQSQIQDNDQLEIKKELARSLAEHVGLSLANLKLREQLRAESIRDPLTNLFNRRHMEESLDREIPRALRSNEPLSIIMIDLDRMKSVNDTYGHVAGDIALKELSSFLQSSMRSSDIVCRYGGEEFLIIMPETTLKSSMERAETIRTRAPNLSIEHGLKKVPMPTCSVGVATLPLHGITADVLVQAADAAVYAAKDKGRNCICVAQEPDVAA